VSPLSRKQLLQGRRALGRPIRWPGDFDRGADVALFLTAIEASSGRPVQRTYQFDSGHDPGLTRLQNLICAGNDLRLY
jgi:hypothetical protein